MNFFLTDPKTGKPSEMVTLTVVVTLAAAFRFLFDGITFNLGSHVITFNHIDSMTYLAFLTPVLGAHSFIGKKKDEKDV